MRKLIPLVCVVALAACADSPTDIGTLAPTDANAAASVYHDNFEYSGCSVWYYDTYCYSTRGILHQTVTPSGNTNYFWKEDGSYTYDWYWGYYHQESEYSYDQHFHIRKGQQQTYSWTHESEYTYTDWYGTAITCSYTDVYRLANGMVTKSVSDYQCTGGPGGGY